MYNTISNKQAKLTFLQQLANLEHTELLTNVRKTLSLLRFMTNNIKADSLRKRSIRIRLNYK